MFRSAFDKFLTTGRSDFRFIVFPAHFGNLALDQKVFRSEVNLSETNFAGPLTLTNATLEGGLIVTTEQLKALQLNGAKLLGPVVVRLKSVEQAISFDNAIASAPVDIQVESGTDFRAQAATFQDVVSVSAGTVKALEISRARFERGFCLRGHVNRSPYGETFAFGHTQFAGHIDWSLSTWRGNVVLAGASFGADSALDISRSTIQGEFSTADAASSPGEVILDGAVIRGETRIAAPFGSPPCRVIAKESAPELRGAVAFRNVDLSRCLLVRNPFQRIEFSTVTWCRLRGGRWGLYDEAALRKRAPIPVSETREACQVLKERYRGLGDHVRSGDFHYGEMEMRRREYRWRIGRFLGPEAWYWIANGYGTRPLRAFLLAALIVIAGAFGYWYDAASEPSVRAMFWDAGFWRALRYSLSVATLQRPTISDDFTEFGKWLYGIQAIVAPVQIALFGLALRMRLKR